MDHSIEHYFSMVEDVMVNDYKIDITTARGTSAGQWTLQLGSATVWVDVFQSKDAQGNPIPGGYIQVVSPVCNVPVINQDLFTKELLEINHSLYGVGFTIFKEVAYIKAIRELQGLDRSEIRATFDRVAIYADDWDDKLKTKYHAFTGGSRA